MQDESTIRVSGRYWRYFPQDAPAGLAEESVELAIDETVFLLIDVLGDPETPPIPDDPYVDITRRRIVPAKAAAKRAGLQVVYVTNSLLPGLSEGNEWRNVSLRTFGVDVLETWRSPSPIIWDEFSMIAPAEGEPLVLKQVYSGFFETNLDSVLRGYGARNLVVVGFDSRVCLGNTVTDAMYRNYRVVVLRDAIRSCEYPETEEGQWNNFLAVRFIEAHVGYTATTDDFINACDAAARARPSG